MHTISNNGETHEIDMTTDEEYILSLKISAYIEPIVTIVKRDFDSVKAFMLQYNDEYRNLRAEDEYDRAAQRAILYGIMVGILQCIERAGDSGVIEQLKEDEETLFLFLPKENDFIYNKIPNMTSERQAATVDLEGIFKSYGLSGEEQGASKRTIRKLQAGKTFAQIRAGDKPGKRGYTKSTTNNRKKRRRK